MSPPPPPAADIDFAGVRERSTLTSAQNPVQDAAPVSTPASTSKKPSRKDRTTLQFLFTLFFSYKFISHRVFGLIYLIQYFIALFMYFYDYEWFSRSILPWSVHMVGLIQSITAALTFTFLRKDADGDQGYFSDKKTVSYQFVLENSFFALIGLFACLYLTPVGYRLFVHTFPIIEIGFVFFPYAIRKFWPKTSFRSGIANPQNKTAKNLQFMDIATVVTKMFYVFFINYVRFMNRMTPIQIYHHRLILLLVFLHTLKFKKYIGPRTAFFIYAAAYMSTFFSYFQMGDILFSNKDLALLAFIGIIFNFGSWELQMGWQCVVCGCCWAARNGLWEVYAPEVVRQILPLKIGDAEAVI
ncbi:hypothetical protein BJ742DRAFT_839197 [Cladochytrium replicatum]|nr:hypothetical protein BJ742DRAFT_839197 [Cladochytrium replicatum]